MKARQNYLSSLNVPVLLAAAVLGLWCSNALAQFTGGTGPGGFTQTGATSDLTMWVKGDAGITKDGSNRVSIWADQSGRGNSQGQGTLNLQPTQTLTLNGVPVLSFDGGTAAQPDFMESAASVQANSLFVVSTPKGFNSCCNPVVGNSNSYVSVRYNNGSWNLPGNDNNDYTFPGGEVRFNGALATNPANAVGTSSFLSLEGDPAFTFTKLTLAQHFTTGNPISARNFNGDIAEVVTFNRVLNTAEKTIVDNHLSSKYNIALNTAGGAVDRYTGDTPGNGNRDFDVFGIGQTTAGNNVTNAGAGGLGFQVTSGLDDGEFILAGHDGAANGISPNIPGPELTGDRWDRSYYIDFNASDLSMDIAFDFSDAGLGVAPDAADTFQLLASVDGINFEIAESGGVLSGDTVLFQNVGTGDFDNGFFTLGINAVVPEPASIAMWLLIGSVAAAFALRRSYFRRAT